MLAVTLLFHSSFSFKSKHIPTVWDPIFKGSHVLWNYLDPSVFCFGQHFLLFSISRRRSHCLHGPALTGGDLIVLYSYRQHSVHDLIQRAHCWAIDFSPTHLFPLFLICNLTTGQSWFFFLEKQISASWNLNRHYNTLSFTWHWTFFFFFPYPS